MISFFLCLRGPAQTLKAYRDANNDLYLEWTATSGYNYTVQSSPDLEPALALWTNHSSWTGHGQTISILVQNTNNPGGGGPLITDLPGHFFSITPFYDELDNSFLGTLLAWQDPAGTPYQLFTNDLYFSENDPPLFETEVTDPSGDYRLLLQKQNSIPFPVDSNSLTLAALPQTEQDRVALLTSVRTQVINDLATQGGITSQSGAIALPLGEEEYFRLLISRRDSDDDGLYDDLETSPDFKLNPYDPDTDHDGVTDPWDHANIDHVIISEFMASNDAFDPDEDGEFQDFIELFNPTDSPLDISGYHLACSFNDLTRWKLPDGVTLGAGETLRIYASGKNQKIPLDPTLPLGPNNPWNPFTNLHTDFGLSIGGESVFLVAPDGLTFVDSHVNWPRQRLNASAGWGLDRETGGVSPLRYFLDPTPGFLNSPTSCTGLSEAPNISPNGGVFFDQTITPTITASGPGEIIHYTLDGSNPTEDSPVYTGQTITTNSTTIVRAIAVSPGCPPSPTTSRSYLFKESVIGTGGQGNPAIGYQVKPSGYPDRPMYDGVPIVLGEENNPSNPRRSASLDFEMNPDVISQHYDTIKNDLSEIPTISISMAVGDLFGPTDGIYARSDDTGGRRDPLQDPRNNDWKRLASVEYIDPSDVELYRQENCEVAISGASTREYSVTAKHNLRLLFKSKFSLKGADTLQFSNKEGAIALPETPITRFKQLQLRNPGQDGWSTKTYFENGDSYFVAERAAYVRDSWARAVHRKMNPPVIGANEDGNWVAHRRWVHLYLNGLYWGLYDMSERIDENFAQAYGDPSASYDVISQGNGAFAEPVAREGTVDGYNTLLARCEAARDDPNHSPANGLSKWEQVEEMLDVDNYIDYYLVNMFMENLDWPNNNWRAIRRRPASPTDSNTHKFKFIVWDAEVGFFSYTSQFNRGRLDQGAAEIHGILMGSPDYHTTPPHPEYVSRFKSRVTAHFYNSGGVFSIDAQNNHASVTIFENAMAEFEPLIRTESARWGDGWDHDNYVSDNYSYTKELRPGWADPGWADPGETGGWETSTDFHRQQFLEPRRAKCLQDLDAFGLKP